MAMARRQLVVARATEAALDQQPSDSIGLVRGLGSF
jgi:hypothetical protein